MLFGEIAIDEGLIDAEQLAEALDIQEDKSDWKIGEILCFLEYLAEEQVEYILDLQMAKPASIESGQQPTASIEIEELRRLWRQILSPTDHFNGQSTVINRELYHLGNWRQQNTSRYEISREIVRGGMGIVFQGRQPHLQRDIALKKLHPEISNSPIHQEKFLAESIVTAYLDHPNIVPVHDIVYGNDGEVMLAMKLVGGTCWARLLHPQTPQQQREARQYDLTAHLEILLQVCNAVAFAHSKGIIHNDLKPANVMIGEYGEVLVMDWGLAVDFREKDGERRALPRSEIRQPIGGTPCYMPPELALGNGQNIGPWTDVYLLGAILCEIATGSPPHMGATVWDVLLNAVYGQAPQFPPEIPRELGKICSTAMARDISSRYRSVTQLRQVLQEFLRHRESVVIAERAQEILQHCQQMAQTEQIDAKLEKGERNRLYDGFAQAIAGFRQALELWRENNEAYRGQHQARLLYAQIAMRNGDIGLAESQAIALEEISEQKQILAQIAHSKREKNRARKRARLLRWSLYAAVATTIVVLSVSILLLNHQQALTDTALRDAKRHAYLAQRQRQRAENYAREVEDQKKIVQQEKEDKAKEARNARIRLARIVLNKADEILGPGKWGERAAYAGEALELLKGLPGVEDLQKLGQSLITIALSQPRLLWEIPSSSSTHTVAHHPDGQIIATADDAAIKLWNTGTGENITTFQGHTGPINAVAFHPNGRVLASASDDNTIRLWDIVTKKLVITLEGHKDDVNAVAFSHDGKHLASASWDKTVLLWEMDSYTFTRLTGHSKAINAVAFNTSDTQLASASDDTTIRIWDIAAKKLVVTLVRHTRAVRSVAFSPDNKLLASASDDNSVRLWNATTGAVIARLNHANDVRCIAFSKDGSIFASCEDTLIRLWDRKTRRIIATLYGYQRVIYSLSFSPTDETLISCSQGAIQLWRVKFLRPQKVLRAPHGWQTAILSNNGNLLAAQGQDKTVRIWQANGKLLSKIPALFTPVTAIAISNDERLAAIACENGTIHIWQIKTAAKISQFSLSGTITTLAFNTKKRQIAIAIDNSIQIRQIEGDLEHVFHGHGGQITSLAFHPDGNILASTSRDKTVALWNLPTRQQIAMLSGHVFPCLQVAFSPDGRLLASSASGKTIKLWDVATNNLRANLMGHRGVVKSLTFATNGRWIATAGDDGEVWLWDIATGRQLTSFAEYRNKICALAFRQDSKSLISLSLHGVKIWDADFTRQIYLTGEPSVALIQRELRRTGQNEKDVGQWLVQHGLAMEPRLVTQILFKLRIEEDFSIRKLSPSSYREKHYQLASLLRVQKKREASR